MGSPCKHGHVDGAMHRPCPKCTTEYHQAENESLRQQVQRLERENNALRWAMWQHCELAESKIAAAFQYHGIPYTETALDEAND